MIVNKACNHDVVMVHLGVSNGQDWLRGSRLHMFGTDNTIRPGEETPATYMCTCISCTVIIIPTPKTMPDGLMSYMCGMSR